MQVITSPTKEEAGQKAAQNDFLPAKNDVEILFDLLLLFSQEK